MKDKSERFWPNQATLPEFDWRLTITIKSLIQDSLCPVHTYIRKEDRANTRYREINHLHLFLSKLLLDILGSQSSDHVDCGFQNETPCDLVADYVLSEVIAAQSLGRKKLGSKRRAFSSQNIMQTESSGKT
jgi:hypothetical protein